MWVLNSDARHGGAYSIASLLIMDLRRFARSTVSVAATLTAMAHAARYRLLCRIGWITFQQASEAVSSIPLAFGYRVRERFYALMLAECGPRLEMNYGATISEAGTRIGADVWIGPYCYVDLVDIGDHVMIGPHVCILAGGRQHRFERLDVPIRLQGNHPLRRTHLGAGCWIGANAVVMADVGEGAIVGAGSLVTRPVPPNAIVAGNPARVLRYRGDDLSSGGPDLPVEAAEAR